MTEIACLCDLPVDQREVLRQGLVSYFTRKSGGWGYSRAALKSLWMKGLLSTNFTDARGFGSDEEAEGVTTTDGGPILLAWANMNGLQVVLTSLELEVPADFLENWDHTQVPFGAFCGAIVQ